MRQLALDWRQPEDPLRIPFPLWKIEELNYYRKFSDQQLNGYVPPLKPFLRPNHPQNRLMIKDNARKYYIDLPTNPLHFDSDGKLEERERPTEEISETADVPLDILRYLEGLAVSLGKERTETVASEVKEEVREEGELVKDKEEFESLTCKEYGDMEEESR
jgi:hypothetical protein